MQLVYPQCLTVNVLKYLFMLLPLSHLSFISLIEGYKSILLPPLKERNVYCLLRMWPPYSLLFFSRKPYTAVFIVGFIYHFGPLFFLCQVEFRLYSFIYLFILFIFWLCWVFVAVCRLSLVAANGAYSSLWHVGFSLQCLLLLWSTGSRCTGFSSCGAWASVVVADGL